ncbi:uncharacterized protein [Pseudochaenichthys georgianus]|uniref:uncharacterized protein n=1 Tax=Pseudochaenichthys georgianus TaxID=52239 RepID=UPI00146ED85C|nr:highly reducing polyketide synthase gloL-like [Pseudochaenichthys georgianus]
MAAVWMLTCVLTVCLARDLSPDKVSLKKAVALFQSIESMLEQDAGKVLHEVDEQLWNGTMSDGEKLNGTMSDGEKLNGTMSDEHKLNGTMSDEHKLNGTMSDEHKLNGTMSDEDKLNGATSTS